MFFNLAQEEGNDSIVRLIKLFLKESAARLLISQSENITADDFKLLILILGLFELINNLAE